MPGPFALHGAEKMLYDARMGPQAIYHDGKVTLAYQGGEGETIGHPHVIAYDEAAGRWSRPRRVGTASRMNHHFAPILWLDDGGYFHLMYNCHFCPGIHLVGAKPGVIDTWRESEPIAESISYPSILRLADGRRVLLYRVEGHLGYWVYRLSDDGVAWSDERLVLDFDRDPTDEIDRWAGSYVAACLSRDRSSLHLGFTRWDERDGAHPRYTFQCDLLTRYSLYYLHLDVDTGELTTIAGERLDAGVNRREAEAAMVIDTTDELTNFPTIAADVDDRPVLLAPISEGSPWTCRFHLFGYVEGHWRQTPIAATDNTWAASQLRIDSEGVMHARLIVGAGKGEEVFYGGGTLTEWTSTDRGDTWGATGKLTPQPGLLYNNPKCVEEADGHPVEGSLVVYGWTGPGGVWATHPTPTTQPNRGRAYLLWRGRWV